jgi:hypothetical protein
MGGEAGQQVVKFSKSQALPTGYEIVFDGHLYWWQDNRGNYGGGDVNRWIVRRVCLEEIRAIAMQGLP